MSLYRFEIQKCIDIEIEADSVTEARMILVNDHSLFQDRMVEDPYISDGVEVK